MPAPILVVRRRHIYLLCFTLTSIAAATRLLRQPVCPRGMLPAYSHNDYINPHPLRDALGLGYKGVEADIFLVAGELRLGHDRAAAQRGAAFEAQYVAPLESLVTRCRTLTLDGTPFLLTVELKESSQPTFDTLTALLARHPSLFSSDSAEALAPTHAAAAVQVVLVGWYPPGFALASPVPLWRQEHLRHARPLVITDPAVALISLDYGKTVGQWWVTHDRRQRWLATIRAIKAAYPALRVRVHDVPVDERVYRELLAAGVDLIGTMRLAETAQRLTSIEGPVKVPR